MPKPPSPLVMLTLMVVMASLDTLRSPPQRSPRSAAPPPRAAPLIRASAEPGCLRVAAMATGHGAPQMGGRRPKHSRGRRPARNVLAPARRRALLGPSRLGSRRKCHVVAGRLLQKEVLPDKRLLENTGAALVHPASPEMNALPRWLLLALFALLIVAPSESFLRRSSFGAAETVGAWPSCRALLAPLSSLTRRCARADLMVPVCAEDTGDELTAPPQEVQVATVALPHICELEDSKLQ